MFKNYQDCCDKATSSVLAAFHQLLKTSILVVIVLQVEFFEHTYNAHPCTQSDVNKTALLSIHVASFLYIYVVNMTDVHKSYTFLIHSCIDEF